MRHSAGHQEFACRRRDRPVIYDADGGFYCADPRVWLALAAQPGAFLLALRTAATAAALSSARAMRVGFIRDAAPLATRKRRA